MEFSMQLLIVAGLILVVFVTAVLAPHHLHH